MHFQLEKLSLVLFIQVSHTGMNLPRYAIYNFVYMQNMLTVNNEANNYFQWKETMSTMRNLIKLFAWKQWKGYNISIKKSISCIAVGWSEPYVFFNWFNGVYQLYIAYVNTTRRSDSSSCNVTNCQYKWLSSRHEVATFV